jgi:glyoxylase-like metal-dependent hydrolase (beta-lactamase superfamily II)
MEIIPGVHLVEGTKGAASYLLDTPAGLLMVDAGIGRGAGALASYLARIGRRPEEVKILALTHSHLDHVRGAREVALLTGAKVYVHRLDAPAVRGEAPLTRANPGIPFSGLLEGLIRFSDSRLFRYRPPPVDKEVGDGEWLGDAGVQAVHAPGHTPGSTCYFHPARGLLFTGDALTNFRGGLDGPVKAFTEDEARCRLSIARLAELDVTACLFGHGDPLVHDAKGAIRTLAAAMRPRKSRP